MTPSYIGTDITAVGIDVAKATLSVCLSSKDGKEIALALRNTNTDISIMVERLQGFEGKIVMEATGHYHWLCALLLTEAGHDVRVVNPILATQYTSGTIRKVKTDPSDASGLARMAQVADNLPTKFTSSRTHLHARKILAVIGSSASQIQALNASIGSIREAQGIIGTVASSSLEAFEATVKQLQKTVTALEKEFVMLAQEDDVCSQQGQRIATIPGVSLFVAHVALHWFTQMNKTTAKSWIAYAGLDISSRESGTWKGTCRLTKRGNAFLRRRLYSAAWGAIMHDDNFKAYYDTLRAQGRPYVETLLIIARKLVRIIFTLLTKNESYDGSKFFAPQLVPNLST